VIVFDMWYDLQMHNKNATNEATGIYSILASNDM
jgi:hypothetical protein